MLKPLFLSPVEYLKKRVLSLGAQERAQLWWAYRRLRRSLRTLPLDSVTTAHNLVEGVMAGQTSWQAISLALKLAQAYTKQTLNYLGAPHRRRRELAKEHFHLVRRHARHTLGLRSLPEEPQWTKGLVDPRLAWRAVCDGSHKKQLSAVGVVAYDELNQMRAQVAFSLPCESSGHVELNACIGALQTLKAFGANQAVIEVDALSVICALEKKLPPHYSVEEARLACLTEQFEALHIKLVPRTHTYLADSLAMKLSRH